MHQVSRPPLPRFERSTETHPLRLGSASSPWNQAAVVGSLWAASEIVLGSFLHNLRIPLRGHFLTLVAVVLLSAIHRRADLRRVAARAGLVAAVLKSVSPSAVLLGPMLAITMEGLLFGLGLRLVRHRLVAVGLAGALAMSWTFCHRLLSLLVVFGWDLVTVYRRLVEHAAESWAFEAHPAVPIAVLLILEVLAGAVAGLVGWRFGGMPRPATPGPSERIEAPAPPPVQGDGPRASLVMALALAVVLPTALWVLGGAGLPMILAICLGVLGLVGWRHPQGLRRLTRPGLWFLVFVVSAAGAWAASVAGGAAASPVLAAARLTSRALVVTAVFTLLARELCHPSLLRLARRLGSEPALEATRTAFAALPAVIESLPRPREILRRPHLALAAGLTAAVDVVDARRTAAPPVVVLTGPIGSGKTTRARELSTALRRRGVEISGVLCPGEVRNGRRHVIDVIDLQSDRQLPLAHREAHTDWQPMGSFWLNPAGLQLGLEALQPGHAELVFVDEIGPWELAGGGWTPAIDHLSRAGVALVVIVREGLVEDVVARWFGARPVFLWSNEVAVSAVADFLVASARAS